MSANRARRLLLLAVIGLAPAYGCQWARNVTWDLSARENEPRDRRYEPTSSYGEQDASYRDSVKEQRAQNGADFRARNPGGSR